MKNLFLTIMDMKQEISKLKLILEELLIALKSSEKYDEILDKLNQPK
jgi:hypothetical protein